MGRDTILETVIRPEEFQYELAEGFRVDRDWLSVRAGGFKEIPCPACSGSDKILLFQKDGFRYHTCENCHTAYISPRPSPEILSDFYSYSRVCKLFVEKIFPASPEVRREKFFRPRLATAIESCRAARMQNPSILEVGAGFGIFCEEARKSQFFNEVIGVEPNRILVEKCRGRGFRTIKKTIENVLMEEIGKVDLVCAFEVIEHLFDPGEFLKRCRGFLPENGLVYFSCPNGKGFDLSMIGSFSDTYNFQHLNYFNPESLRLLLERSGYQVLSLRTPGKLDVDLVRKATLSGKTDLSHNAFFKQVLLGGDESRMTSFQEFLVANKLSGHMEIVAQKIGRVRNQ